MAAYGTLRSVRLFHFALLFIKAARLLFLSVCEFLTPRLFPDCWTFLRNNNIEMTIMKTQPYCKWNNLTKMSSGSVFLSCVSLAVIFFFFFCLFQPPVLSAVGLIISDCTAGLRQMWILYSSEHRLYTFISSHSPQQCKCHVAGWGGGKGVSFHCASHGGAGLQGGTGKASGSDVFPPGVRRLQPSRSERDS